MAPSHGSGRLLSWAGNLVHSVYSHVGSALHPLTKVPGGKIVVWTVAGFAAGGAAIVAGGAAAAG